jgi:hypothetical protein
MIKFYWIVLPCGGGPIGPFRVRDDAEAQMQYHVDNGDCDAYIQTQTWSDARDAIGGRCAKRTY